MPFHFANQKGEPAIARRQCTGDYKIKPVRKFLQEKFGASKENPVELWLGFGLEEAHRQKPDDIKYVQKYHPLIDHRITTAECEKYLENLGLPVPESSSCTVCPYHKNSHWGSLSPEELEVAYRFDEQVRDKLYNRQPEGRKNPPKSVKVDENQLMLLDLNDPDFKPRPHDPEHDKLYLHRERIPLREVDFHNENQLEMFGEDSVCGEGCMT